MFILPGKIRKSCGFRKHREELEISLKIGESEEKV